jgi:hypothetical protein
LFSSFGFRLRASLVLPHALLVLLVIGVVRLVADVSCKPFYRAYWRIWSRGILLEFVGPENAY